MLQLTIVTFGGKGIRTPDFQLAKLALYQLSYAPTQDGDCRWQIANLQTPVLADPIAVWKRRGA